MAICPRCRHATCACEEIALHRPPLDHPEFVATPEKADRETQAWRSAPDPAREPLDAWSAHDRRVRLRFVGVACVVLLFVGCQRWAANKVCSQGERYGVIVKWSKKGWLWPTSEFTLRVTGVGPGATLASDEFPMSIDAENPDEVTLAVKAREAALAGSRVRVQYTQVINGWPWRGATDYYVSDIEVVR